MAPKYFSWHDLWRVMGKKCRACGACAWCRAAPHNPHRINRFPFATGKVSHVPSRRVKLCGLWWRKPRSLTVAARPLDSSTESGGPSSAAADGGQTGNSGAIPGRPRRCVQATSRPQTGDRPADIRAIARGSATPTGSREGDSRSSLGVRRPTSIRWSTLSLRGRSNGPGPHVRAGEWRGSDPSTAPRRCSARFRVFTEPARDAGGSGRTAWRFSCRHAFFARHAVCAGGWSSRRVQGPGLVSRSSNCWW